MGVHRTYLLAGFASRTAHALAACVAILASVTSGAAAEFQCSPAATKVKFPKDNLYYAEEVKHWAQRIRSRYLEGNGDCDDVAVPGYKGFPTKRCRYKSADAGEGHFERLSAEVILLNPSSKQLAAWSVSACSINNTPQAAMAKCLSKLRDHVIGSNGAQFPVVGSVVESPCSRGKERPSCKGLEKDDRSRRPTHTWFRDGLSIDYLDGFQVHWDETAYPPEKFDVVLDVSKSDASLQQPFFIGRLGGIDRKQWIEWRDHRGVSKMAKGSDGATDGHAWRTVLAAVHKAACTSNSNELFNAAVFAHPEWRK